MDIETQTPGEYLDRFFTDVGRSWPGGAKAIDDTLRAYYCAEADETIRQQAAKIEDLLDRMHLLISNL